MYMNKTTSSAGRINEFQSELVTTCMQRLHTEYMYTICIHPVVVMCFVTKHVFTQAHRCDAIKRIARMLVTLASVGRSCHAASQRASIVVVLAHFLFNLRVNALCALQQRETVTTFDAPAAQHTTLLLLYALTHCVNPTFYKVFAAPQQHSTHRHTCINNLYGLMSGG